MEIISTKVEKETKEKMKKLAYINWSEVIRESLKSRIAVEETRLRSIDRDKLKEGIRIASGLRRSAKTWNSTEEIRKWRNRVR